MKKADLLVLIGSLKSQAFFDKDMLKTLRDEIYSLLLKNGDLVPEEILYLANCYFQANLQEKEELQNYIKTADKFLPTLNDNEKKMMALLKAVCLMLNSNKYAIIEYAKILLTLKDNDEFLMKLISNFSPNEYNEFIKEIFKKDFFFNLKQQEQKNIIINLKLEKNLKIYLNIFCEFAKKQNIEMCLFLWEFFRLDKLYDFEKINLEFLSKFTIKQTKIKKHKQKNKINIGFIIQTLNEEENVIYYFSMIKALLNDKEIATQCEFYFYDCMSDFKQPNAFAIIDFIKLGINYSAPTANLLNDYDVTMQTRAEILSQTILKDNIDMLINLSPKSLMLKCIYMQNLAKKQSFALPCDKIPLDTQHFFNPKQITGMIEVTKEFYKNKFIFGSLDEELDKEDIEFIKNILNKIPNSIFIATGKQKITKKYKNIIFAGNVDCHLYANVIDFYLSKNFNLNAKKFLFKANKAGLFYGNCELECCYLPKDEILKTINTLLDDNNKLMEFKKEIRINLIKMQKENLQTLILDFKEKLNKLAK